MQNEGVHPAKMAYDRPSVKYLAFLRKHYGLDKYRQQVRVLNGARIVF